MYTDLNSKDNKRPVPKRRWIFCTKSADDVQQIPYVQQTSNKNVQTAPRMRYEMKRRQRYASKTETGDSKPKTRCAGAMLENQKEIATRTRLSTPTLCRNIKKEKSVSKIHHTHSTEQEPAHSFLLHLRSSRLRLPPEEQVVHGSGLRSGELFPHLPLPSLPVAPQAVPTQHWIEPVAGPTVAPSS